MWLCGIDTERAFSSETAGQNYEKNTVCANGRPSVYRKFQ